MKQVVAVDKTAHVRDVRISHDELVVVSKCIVLTLIKCLSANIQRV